MKEHICNKYKIKLNLDKQSYAKMLTESFKLFGKVYSIFVNKTYTSGQLSGYSVSVIQFEEEQYNTINPLEHIAKIIEAIDTCTDNYRVYFVQPSLEIMYEIYYNYIYKLSLDIVKRFPEYLFDDVLQICSLAIVKLYNAGYYLNKRLIKTTLYNEIYQEHRRNSKQVKVVHIICDENDDKIDLLEEYKDVAEDMRQEQAERDDVIQYVMTLVRPVIIETIGERRLKSLMDNQKASCCNAQNKNDLKALCRALKKLGYDLEWFRKQFE